jgi:hypothetical protein
VAFCREKNLSPMSGQLFAFVFSKDDAKKPNMVGTLERVEIGKFFDRVDAHTRQLAPADVTAFATRNREALREFWGRAKNDALELKNILEQRSDAVTPPHPSELRDDFGDARPAGFVRRRPDPRGKP